jgi:protein-disulfide isomerase
MCNRFAPRGQPSLRRIGASSSRSTAAWCSRVLATEQDLPVGPDDPILGPASAPLQLVVFSYFQCPTCVRYARELHTMVDQYANQLQVVFKHFPLDKTCNPGMSGDFNLHPRACEAAYAAEAANRQGKFWRFHDELFTRNLWIETTTIESIARDSGLDLERFETDRREIPTLLKVHTDLALGGSLKLRGTPTLFLNRRPVPSIRPQDVRVLIYQLLQDAAQVH